MEARVVLLNDRASVPRYTDAGAAGADVCASDDAVVPARGRALVRTGVSMTAPEGTYMRVAPRSGLALKKGIDVMAGVIDRNYTGEIGVILVNHSDEDFVVSVGDRVAQLIAEKIAQPAISMVESLDPSERGGAGFGSTGV